MAVDRTAALKDGDKRLFFDEPTYLNDLLSLFPNEITLRKRCDQAEKTLEQLSNEEASPRMLKMASVEGQWHVFRPATSTEESQPLLSELAQSALFKERHLRVGKQAPLLEVELLDGTAWNLVEHRGKVVILQFSFTGCGPCEEMYSILKQIVEDYQDRVEILTLMCDKTDSSALAAASSERITWNISHDGKPGRITSKWSVVSFPTTYVIDLDGRISSTEISNDQLHDLVARLLEPTDD